MDDPSTKKKEKRACSCKRLKNILGECLVNATRFEEDKWWCWRHAPSRKALLEDKAKAEREIQRQKDERRYRRIDLELAARLRPSDIAFLTDDEVRALIHYGGLHSVVREMLTRLNNTSKEAT